MVDVNKESFLLITLDSCRYDTYLNSDTPNLDKIGKVQKAFAPGNFTFPSHMAMFCGFTPGDPKSKVDFANPKVKRLWKLGDDAQDGKQHLMSLPGANIVDGFNKLGYETIGTGGVEWFNPARVASKMLIDRFRHFEYFGSYFYLSKQIEWLMERIKVCRGKRKFVFLNIGETHGPYWHEGAPWDRSRWNLSNERFDRQLSEYRQKKCLEFVDNALKGLLNETAGYNIMVCGDHGDAWGEDGLWEHSIHHEKVYEVPLIIKANTDVDYAAISRAKAKDIDDAVEKDMVVKRFDRVVAERDETIRKLEERLAQKDEMLAMLNGQMIELDSDFRRQLANKDAQMSELRAMHEKELVVSGNLLAETSAAYEERLSKKDAIFADLERRFIEKDKEMAKERAGFDGRIEEMNRRIAALNVDFERRLSDKDNQMAAEAASYEGRLAEKNSTIAEKDSMIIGLNGRIEEMNRRIAALNVDFERRLSDKDNQMAAGAASYEGRLAEKDSLIDGLNNQLGEQASVLDEKNRQLIERDQRIEALLRSLSWRITSPLRRIFGIFVNRRD